MLNNFTKCYYSFTIVQLIYSYTQKNVITCITPNVLTRDHN